MADDDKKFLLSEIKYRTDVSNMRLLELKVESVRLANEKAQLDLDDRTGRMCYISTALKEFSKVLNPFVGEIKGLPDDLQTACNLSPDQYRAVQMVVNDLLKRLSGVRVSLESSSELKARASALSAKNSAVAEKAKIVKRDGG